MSAEVITFLLFAFAIGVAASWHLIGRLRCWVAQTGFRLRKARKPWQAVDNRFPFTPVSGTQQVYQIHIQDEAGTEKTGWILLGSLWMGLASTQAQIVWE